MTKNKLLTLISLSLLVLFGCQKEIDDKYARPEWLAGKLYTQIKTQPDLSTFAELLHVSGYDTIIDVSGSYTIFAPSNDAFKKYFQENSKYKSVADIPKAEVIKLVKYHLVQNPWSKKQLRSLDIFGWIDTLDLSNNLPKGYKRETLLLEKNQKYGVAWSKYKRQNSTLKRTDIIDSTKTSWNRRVFTDSRKFSPIFFKEYFDIYDLSTSDYSFYFGRPFENNNDIYFSNGRVVGDEVFAENGFIYVIDRVAEPLKNGVEILTDQTKPNSYSSFYNLVNLFAELEYNQKETNDQPGADQGLKVDSLFNLRYPQLIFDINSEKTKAPRGVFGLPGNVTIRYHHGIVAPTNEAFNQLINQYLVGGNNWGSLDAAPENIKRIIANSSLSINPIYLTDINRGFLNGEADIIQIDESSIVQKQYGSNCTFIGVNKPIVPRAFSSVTGPVYTRKGYSKVMYAIEKSGLLSALKRKNSDYSFYVEADMATSADSSFFYDPVSERFTAVTMYPSIRQTTLSNDDLRTLFLNQIGLSQPKGIARKEFIKTLGGNYLTVNNVTKEVRGTAPSTYGYRGVKQVTVIPRKISTNADNGSTYEVDSWFAFNANDIFSAISTNFPKFHALIKKAGLTQDKLFKYSFMSDNQSYTVFAPSDSVLNTVNLDALTQKELQNLVMMHFIQGEMIFTDGNKQAAYYETARIDESSTAFVIKNTMMKINPGIDKIVIPSKNGTPVAVVNESNRTNIITSRNLSTTGLEAFTTVVSNGVIHEIKSVLRFEEIDNN
ncbi:MAG TPA: hypothetical protein DHV48_17630 [Prolixibacteraceae bacterium]|nr:hypothetical protein [Prolixibacteraceae bacterium]